MHQIVSKKKKFLSASFLIFAVGMAAYIGLFYPEKVRAGLGESSIGFAWGGGATINSDGYAGIGWISANNLGCDIDQNGFIDAGSCGGNNTSTVAYNYGVNIPFVDGDLFGYAWSEHYGWLSFNVSDLGGCPSGTCSARRTGDVINGWARFIAIRDAGGNSGDWSGWLSLSGTAQDGSLYGVSIAGNALSGYAWSDELGWLDFSGVTISSSPSTLKICENSCSSLVTRGKGGETTDFSMAQGTSQDLVACSNTAPIAPITNPCSDPLGQVTADWVESNATGGALSLSSVVATNVDNKPYGFLRKMLSSTAMAALADTIRVTGTASGTESFTATYNGITATMNTSVTCVSTNTCATDPQRDQICTGTSYTIDNGCGIIETCPGNRYCDFNWKEVAP